jgi:membrane protein
MRRVRAAVTSFWRKAYEDNLTGLSGMVAYNLLLSIFPLALVALFVAGRVLRSQELQDSVLLDLERVFPSAAESTLSEAVRRLQQSSTTTGILAIVASIWFASSFWGALDTAFCRIYHRPCRSWIRQKLFALGMFAVVLLFVAASVAVPTLQSLIATGASDLPFGLSDVRHLVYWVTLALGVVVLFGALCLTYQLVPRGTIPWRCVWPGALGATVAMGIVDYGFPLYLQNVSALRAGTTFVFVLIALVWFYVLALILLAGAVVNELRFERLDREGADTLAVMPDPRTEEMQLEQLQRERSERDQAGEAAEPAEEKAHGRRAERAAYLRDKLAERARSEDEADG